MDALEPGDGFGRMRWNRHYPLLLDPFPKCLPEQRGHQQYFKFHMYFFHAFSCQCSPSKNKLTHLQIHSDKFETF